MKKNKIFRLMTAFLLVFIFTAGVVPCVQAAPTTDFRAMWVSSAYNLDFPSKRSLTNNELKKEIDTLIDRASAMGLTALIVQVRPAADALYASALFPWSETLTGTQGKAPVDNFDPLAYWVERAHAKGLELHAWINPFRITYASAKITDVKKLSADHPARQNPSWAVAYKDALYFDPGRPECRQLIADGVTEIIKNYAVDGIHLDDYFYPGTDFNDDATYKQYGQGMNRDDWRRENVNALVKLLQKTAHAANPNLRYGISPMAIWQNASSDTRGSATRGYETYKSSYADTRRWVKEGWVDYICPQIYWYIGYDIADYATVLRWWEDVCKGTGVSLYVGHAAYKEAEGTANWTGEIVRQLKLNAQSKVVQGSVFFRAGSLSGSVGNQIADYYAKQTPSATPAPGGSLPIIPLPPSASSIRMDKLTVAQPSADTAVTGAQGYNILGTCNPDKPLYINGQPVASRTSEGFFSYYAPLVKGENRFTLSQDSQVSVTRVITLKDAAVTQPATMSAAVVTNAYPSADEMGVTGSTVTLSCTAPARAKVTAKINGATVTLNQDNASIKSTASTIYAARFSGTYTLPAGKSGVVSDLGQPVYTMEYNGKTSSATAKGSVKIIGGDAPLYAEVTAESAWVYAKASTNGGSSWSLQKNQTDRVTAVTGNGAWIKLASGGWIEAEQVKISTNGTLPLNALSNGTYIKGINEDMLVWKAAANPAVNIDFDGKQMTVRFGMQKGAPSFNFSLSGSVFDSLNIGTSNNAPCYTLTLREGVKLEGFYTDYANGELRLHLKKRRALASGNKPLTGFTFVIDAGHGQSDSGALGPMGKSMPEKDINLSNTQKLASRLTQLGASVMTTRVTDTALTLQERTELNRAVNPDLFISMHANSMEVTTDTSEIRGLTVWYRNANSTPLASELAARLHTVNPRTTRRPVANQSNFYVCRPSWTPSVIIETSFICNVEDFSWMISEKQQINLADTIANAILAYFA